MLRPVSPSIRVLRALVGLVTLWCLGCAAYEPLFNSVLDVSESAMDCASMMPQDGEPAAASAPTTGQTQTTVVAPVRDGRFGCGCTGSCYAPSPTSHAPATSPDRLQAVMLAAPVEPSSVTRTPLLPPPELAA